MLFVQKRRQNTFCLDTYVIRDKNCIGYCCQDPSTLKDKIEIAIMAGYSAVELWNKDVKGFLDKEKSFDSIKTMMSGKIFVASYKVLENWFEGTCQNYREILETAAGIGAKSYVVKLIGDYKHFTATNMKRFYIMLINIMNFCQSRSLTILNLRLNLWHWQTQ